MDIDKLKATVEKLKQEQASSGGSQGEWPNTVFMPEGTHKGRFIIDPNDEVYHKMLTYGYFASGVVAPETLDDSVLPDGFNKDNHPLKELSEILVEDYLKFGKGAKISFLTYFYLIETDNRSEDWEPGKLYCVVGNGRVAGAFTEMLSSLVSDSPEQILSSLSPDKEGPIMQVIFSMGTQGKCTISPTFKTHPPLVERTDEDTDETYGEKIGKLGYKPLEISYIKPGFNQEKYDNLVKRYTEELEGLAKNKKKEPEKEEEKKEEKEEKPAESSNSESSDSSEPTKEEEKSSESAPADDIPEESDDDPFAKYRKQN